MVVTIDGIEPEIELWSISISFVARALREVKVTDKLMVGNLVVS